MNAPNTISIDSTCLAATTPGVAIGYSTYTLEEQAAMRDPWRKSSDDADDEPGEMERRVRMLELIVRALMAHELPLRQIELISTMFAENELPLTGALGPWLAPIRADVLHRQGEA